MTSGQKTLIRDSWHQVVPIADQAASMFYDRLFETDPGLRALFAHVDMPVQRRKLVQALYAVIGALDSLEAILPQLTALGRNHANYGVTDAHYDTVGAALMWTLEQGLGDRWSAEAEAAWAAAYALVANAMRAGAAKAADEHALERAGKPARAGHLH